MTTPPPEERERIARIIDPGHWANVDAGATFDAYPWLKIEIEISLAKADAILADFESECEAFGKAGERDGYEQAVQDIDLLTGGDGEYRFCTDGDPERHTPDAEAMKARIAERFRTLPTPIAKPLGAALEALEDARDALHEAWERTGSPNDLAAYTIADERLTALQSEGRKVSEEAMTEMLRRAKQAVKPIVNREAKNARPKDWQS